MTATFTCTLEQFKVVVAEFCKAAPTADAEALDAGIKCVGLHYLGIEPLPASGSYEEIIAVSYLGYANRRELDRTVQLAIEARQ